MDRLFRSGGGRQRGRARAARGRAWLRCARPAERHRQDLHGRDPRRRHVHLRGPALFRAVAGRERADAGADPHRRRRAAQGLRARLARRRSRGARAQVHPRHRDRRRDRGRSRRDGARAQPLGRSAVRLRVRRDGAPPVRRAVRAGKRARRARLSRRADEERRRQRAQRRARGDRPRAPGRADPAVHDHGPRRRRGEQVLRRAARHHAVEARRGRPAQRQAHRRARLVGEIGFPRQDLATRSARRSTPSSASPR